MPANTDLVATIRAAEHPWEVPGLRDSDDLVRQRLIARHVDLAMLVREEAADGVLADALVADALVQNPTLTHAELPALIAAWHDQWCAVDGHLRDRGPLIALLDERLGGWGREICALWEERAEEQGRAGLPSWKTELLRATRCPWSTETWRTAALQSAGPAAHRDVAPGDLIRLWSANTTLGVSDRWAFTDQLVADAFQSNAIRTVVRRWVRAAVEGAPEQAVDILCRWPAMALALQDAGLLAMIAHRVPAHAADRRAFLDAVFVSDPVALDRLQPAVVLQHLGDLVSRWVADDPSLLVTFQTHPSAAVRLWGATVGAGATVGTAAQSPGAVRPR